MKCSPHSLGLVNIIALVCDDIVNDKSDNDLKTSLELIEEQVTNIRHIDDITPEEGDR